MRNKLMWVLMFLGAIFAPLVKFFQRKSEEESNKRGEELKAKVAEVKAEQAARKEATDAAVAQVDQAAMVEAKRDSVELANDLIWDAKGGSDPVTKG
jgi:uncharacterized protein YdaU (DUF1376 family)